MITNDIGGKNISQGLTVAQLIAHLQVLPPDLCVMVPAEGGVNHLCKVRVTDVVQHPRNWAGTPVGQFRELPQDETVGEVFSVVLLEF
jgi:DNA-binding transcriptional regulator LsrR (DeoR family)